MEKRSVMNVTHIGFADESHWNVGRFRSLALVTTSLDQLECLNKQLVALLNESGISEFKWKSLSGARERFAAQKLCRFVVDQACKRVLRVDVLVWDIRDSRHNVRGRDDIANLQRMYYHLFRNVIRLRWPKPAVWRFHPDEHTAMNWETVQACLEKVSGWIETEAPLLTQGKFRFLLQQEFGIEEICPVASNKHPLLQIADLFAGLAVFSREKFNEYKQWLKDTSGQRPLIEELEEANTPSRSAEERFQVLKGFDTLCKQKKLGVSLQESKGLRTHDPNNPINFWLYEPQHPADKAPTR